jgi:hypothetical protein
MKDNGFKINNKVMEHKRGLMEQFTKVNFIMVTKMEKATLYGLMVAHTKANSNKTIWMDMEPING